MTYIPVSAGMIDFGIQRTFETGAEKVEHVVEFVGPRVVCFEDKISHAPAQLYLQRIVIGTESVSVDVFISKIRIRTRVGKDIFGICIKSGEIDASLHVVTVISNVIHRQNRVPRHFLLDAEQPVVGNLVFRILWKCNHVLCSGGQWRIRRRICDVSLEQVHAVTGKRRDVGSCGEVKVHRIVEYSSISVNDRLSPAEGIPGETDTRRYVTFRRTIGGLVERKKRDRKS